MTILVVIFMFASRGLRRGEGVLIMGVLVLFVTLVLIE
jgi:hypothetical protein